MGGVLGDVGVGGGLPLCHSDTLVLNQDSAACEGKFPCRLENIWIFRIGETLSHRDANVASPALQTCILLIHVFGINCIILQLQTKKKIGA